MLPLLDTGITHLGGEGISFDNLPLSDAIRSKLQEDVAEGETVRLMAQASNERFIITRKSGELIAKKLVAFHSTLNGSEVQFEIRQESDGSQRVIDLLPAFLEISAKNSHKVYVIDELDRSLHTLLTRRLLEGYLQNCTTESRSQLLLTTHDALLMDQNLLRRDEMWVAERDHIGASHLISFSDYEGVRYDKDIRKSYLDGRFGGIPRILLSGSLISGDAK
jgi:AAA15 family ATPase/GTPase